MEMGGGERSQVLVAGDGRDLPRIRELLGALPDSAYGQVFVEVLTAEEVEPLAAPEGVAVLWLCRDRLPSRVDPLVFAGRGEALAGAVAAWAAEWAPARAEDGLTACHAWVGCAASAFCGPVLDALVRRVLVVSSFG